MADETFRFTWTRRPWADALRLLMAMSPGPMLVMPVIGVIAAAYFAHSGDPFVAVCFVVAFVVLIPLSFVRIAKMHQQAAGVSAITFAHDGVISEGTVGGEVPWTHFEFWTTSFGQVVLKGPRIPRALSRPTIVVPMRAIPEAERPALYALLDEHLPHR